ncbi:hypothetical protein JB92DRAFT_1434974 [Gautieria morchelliformis]|nr:hypothetical protein JB92DRAFT_1434974 [Gautieria morchelliformis]
MGADQRHQADGARRFFIALGWSSHTFDGYTGTNTYLGSQPRKNIAVLTCHHTLFSCRPEYPIDRGIPHTIHHSIGYISRCPQIHSHYIPCSPIKSPYSPIFFNRAVLACTYVHIPVRLCLIPIRPGFLHSKTYKSDCLLLSSSFECKKYSVLPFQFLARTRTLIRPRWARKSENSLIKPYLDDTAVLTLHLFESAKIRVDKITRIAESHTDQNTSTSASVARDFEAVGYSLAWRT